MRQISKSNESWERALNLIDEDESKKGRKKSRSMRERERERDNCVLSHQLNVCGSPSFYNIYDYIIQNCNLSIEYTFLWGLKIHVLSSLNWVL